MGRCGVAAPSGLEGAASSAGAQGPGAVVPYAGHRTYWRVTTVVGIVQASPAGSTAPGGGKAPAGAAGAAPGRDGADRRPPTVGVRALRQICGNQRDRRGDRAGWRRVRRRGGGAGRGGRGQDRPARRGRGAGWRDAGVAGHRRRVRVRPRVRGAAPGAVAGGRFARGAARAAARCAARGPGARRGQCRRPVPGRSRGALAAGRGGRAGRADVRGRRLPVGRPGLGRRAAVRRQAAGDGTDRDGVRRTRGCSRQGCAADGGGARPGRVRRGRAAGIPPRGAARPGETGARHADRREPARPG